MGDIVIRIKWNQVYQVPNATHTMCLVAQWYLTLCNPMNCSLPGSSVHGMFQARILEWVAISSSRGTSQPRDQTHISCISCIGKWILYHWAIWKAHIDLQVLSNYQQCSESCPCPKTHTHTAFIHSFLWLDTYSWDRRKKDLKEWGGTIIHKL